MTTKQYIALSVFLFIASLGILFGVVNFASASQSDIMVVPYSLGGNQATDLYSYGTSSVTGVTFPIASDTNGYFYWDLNGVVSGSAFNMASTSVSALNYSTTLGSHGSGYRGYAIYTRGGGSDNRMRLGSSFTGSVGSIVSSFSIDGVSVSLVKWDGFSASTTASVLGSNGFRIDTARPSSPGRLYLISYTNDNLDYIDTQAEYYALVDSFQAGGPIPGAINTRIVSQNSPANGSLSSSEFVQFDFDYFNNDTDTDPVTFAGVDIRDVSSGFEYAPIEEMIISSGNASFGPETVQLQSDHFHMWRPYLRNASSTRVIYGSWYSFDVVDYSGDFDPVDPSGGSATSTQISQLLGVQGFFQSRFPFAYFYDIGSLLSAVDDEVAEGQFPSLDLSFGTSSALHMGTVTMFSSSTLSYFAGSSTVSLIRTMMAFSIWLAFALAVWFQVKKIFHHSQSNK